LVAGRKRVPSPPTGKMALRRGRGFGGRGIGVLGALFEAADSLGVAYGKRRCNAIAESRGQAM